MAKNILFLCLYLTIMFLYYIKYLASQLCMVLNNKVFSHECSKYIWPHIMLLMYIWVRILVYVLHFTLITYIE